MAVDMTFFGITGMRVKKIFPDIPAAIIELDCIHLSPHRHHAIHLQDYSDEVAQQLNKLADSRTEIERDDGTVEPLFKRLANVVD